MPFLLNGHLSSKGTWRESASLFHKMILAFLRMPPKSAVMRENAFSMGALVHFGVHSRVELNRQTTVE